LRASRYARLSPLERRRPREPLLLSSRMLAQALQGRVHYVFEVGGATPATRAEKSTHRKREFQAALRLTLGALRVRDPSNEIWAEALHLLEDPRLRTSDGSH
jgi:hypothetical protein